MLSEGFDLTGAGEAKGLRLLLFVLGFKFFFWNSACIFHKPFRSLLSSEALLGTAACLAELPCLLCRSLILLVMEARPARPNEGAGS
jgi:hypothetical protein